MVLMTGLLTLSQVFFKKLLIEKGNVFASLKSFFYMFFDFYAVLAIFTMLGAMFLWTKLLVKNDFTLIYPLVSISYIWALIAGIYIFDESVSINKYVGICFIFTGIYFLSRK